MEFWYLYVMMMCSMIFGTYFWGSVKSAAGGDLADDRFTSMIATISSLMGILKIVWSVGLLKFNFRTNYALLLTV